MYDADSLARITRRHNPVCKPLGAHVQTAPPQLVRQALLAFELRWKLEDTVLIPSLQDTEGVMQGGAREARLELDALRNLAALTRYESVDVEGRGRLLYAIEALAALRSERVDRGLARAHRAGLVDMHALAQEMDRSLVRWLDEMRRTGEIADEVVDPLALALT